jgi:hypothetical protein
MFSGSSPPRIKPRHNPLEPAKPVAVPNWVETVSKQVPGHSPVPEGKLGTSTTTADYDIVLSPRRSNLRPTLYWWLSHVV